MSVDQYLAAQLDFERIDKEITNITNVIATAATGLQSGRDHFIFSNCEPGLPILRSPVTVDASGWRTAKQIQELLAKWHEAKSVMLSAWERVPVEHRGSLVPPRQAECG